MSESTVLKTKFGNAKIDNKGYYTITSRKEGNMGKKLHRLLFEEFYNINLNEEFPNGVHIHHIDKNKTNNEIWNLEPIAPREHIKLHQTGESHSMFGKYHSPETKFKTSKSLNTTGFFRVIKAKHKKCKQGFEWLYVYYIQGDSKQYRITSVDLLKLKNKVLLKGLEWGIVDLDNAKQTANEYNYDLGELL